MSSRGPQAGAAANEQREGTPVADQGGGPAEGDGTDANRAPGGGADANRAPGGGADANRAHVGGADVNRAPGGGVGVSRAGEGGVDEGDAVVVRRQLGRLPRGAWKVAHRCPCGLPDVVETAPRLPGGEPFPTLFYLTCPRAASLIGTLESSGMMREMQARLADDPELAARYRAAHDDYVARRDKAAAAEGLEPLPRGMQSAGGMPSRVKCLHALVGHELAVPGSNPFGREALGALPDWWATGPCVSGEETATGEGAG